ncbi:MAG: dihydrolipoyl dehydrogenase [Deltaproteobacteria bacterium]|nr:dihydrolipoyl dehydrogenase [Deltaproteobacteria bacterium]
MNTKSCELLVLGGGPGGYTAAIRAARKGLKTILVEKGHLGGTCLNRGCVPTKTLIEDTQMIPAVSTSHFLRGDMKIGVSRIVERKKAVVEGSRQWVRSILKGSGVTFMEGQASFVSPKELAVRDTDGNPIKLSASKVIIATGAVEDYGAGPKPDGNLIWSTDDALSLKTVPRRLAVVGAGNRGVEFASIYRNLGAGVLLVEKNRRVLPHLDPEFSDRYKKALLGHKIKVLTGTTLSSAQPDGKSGVTVVLEGKQGSQEIVVDRVLQTGHRRPHYEGLNLDAAGLVPDNGMLAHSDGLETAVEGIYVIGDAAGPPYYAHKAISHGIAAVDHLMGDNSVKPSPFMPHCIWGNPEVAAVGLTEDEAIDQGHEVKTGEFHFVGNGRAGTMGIDQGLVLIVSDAESREVLGVHMMGPHATELISLATLAMENHIPVDGIKKAIFAHPTLSETFFEAALAVDGEAIHLMMD